MNNPIRLIDPDGMSALYDCPNCGTSVEGNRKDAFSDDGENDMVNYLTFENKSTHAQFSVITGDAGPGAHEYSVSGLNGGAGVPFRSEDEAAFAWSLENMQYTAVGSREHASTIYSMSGKDGNTFSYNGSWEGTEDAVHYNEDKIPKGSRIEGYIHTHDHQPNFSTHMTLMDKNQRLDTGAMDSHTDKDFYLLNHQGELLVNRRLTPFSSNDSRNLENQTLVTGMFPGNAIPKINPSAWLNAKGEPYGNGKLAPFVQDFYKKYHKNK